MNTKVIGLYSKKVRLEYLKDGKWKMFNGFLSNLARILGTNSSTMWSAYSRLLKNDKTYMKSIKIHLRRVK